jgi:hypothetical protein
MLVFWVVNPYGLVGDASISEKHPASIFKAVYSFKMLVSTYKTTQHDGNNPDVGDRDGP